MCTDVNERLLELVKKGNIKLKSENYPSKLELDCGAKNLYTLKINTSEPIESEQILRIKKLETQVMKQEIMLEKAMERYRIRQLKA